MGLVSSIRRFAPSFDSRLAYLAEIRELPDHLARVGERHLKVTRQIFQREQPQGARRLASELPPRVGCLDLTTKVLVGQHALGEIVHTGEPCLTTLRNRECAEGEVTFERRLRVSPPPPLSTLSLGSIRLGYFRRRERTARAYFIQYASGIRRVLLHVCAERA